MCKLSNGFNKTSGTGLTKNTLLYSLHSYKNPEKLFWSCLANTLNEDKLRSSEQYENSIIVSYQYYSLIANMTNINSIVIMLCHIYVWSNLQQSFLVSTLLSHTPLQRPTYSAIHPYRDQPTRPYTLTETNLLSHTLLQRPTYSVIHPYRDQPT